MLVHNLIGDTYLWVLSGLTGHQMRGAVFGSWFTFIDSGIDLESKDGKALYLHEKVHQWQMERMGLVGFCVKYYADFFTLAYRKMQEDGIPFSLSLGWVKQLLKRGYSEDLPLEKEAYYLQNCYQEM